MERITILVNNDKAGFFKELINYLNFVEIVKIERIRNERDDTASEKIKTIRKTNVPDGIETEPGPSSFEENITHKYGL